MLDYYMSGRGDLWYLHCGKGIVAAVDKLQRVETLFASQKVFEKTRAQDLVREWEDTQAIISGIISELTNSS